MVRCLYFSTHLSKVRINAGRMTTVQMTPSATPFAMTMPMSRPSVRRMAHRARKPAMVVSDEAEIEVMVLQMALTMASSLEERSSFSS